MCILVCWLTGVKAPVLSAWCPETTKLYACPGPSPITVSSVLRVGSDGLGSGNDPPVVVVVCTIYVVPAGAESEGVTVNVTLLVVTDLTVTSDGLTSSTTFDNSYFS